MDRQQLIAAVQDLDDASFAAVAAVLEPLMELRLGGQTSARVFGEFHAAGLPATLVLQTKPGRRERERVEASVTTGNTVQLALEFDALRTA